MLPFLHSLALFHHSSMCETSVLGFRRHDFTSGVLAIYQVADPIVVTRLALSHLVQLSHALSLLAIQGTGRAA